MPPVGAPQALDEVRVRQIIRQEMRTIFREGLPASMQTQIHTANELRAVERFNLDSRTLVTLDDKQPALGTYLGVDANGFAQYAVPPGTYVAPPLGGTVLTGNAFVSDPAAPITAGWRLGGSGGMLLPRMTTAQRPATPSKGETHWNETTGNPEVYDGTSYITELPVSDVRHMINMLRDMGASVPPLGYTMDPATIPSGQQFTATRDRLYMAAFTVPKAVVTTGIRIFCEVAGTGYPGTMYNGAGLWQFAANGDATFIIDSGAADGTPFATTGTGGWSWTTPQTLTSDVVYLVGFQYMQTAAGTLAALRGSANSMANVSSFSPFFRCGGVGSIANGAARAACMKSWTVAQMALFTNMPLIVVI